MTLAKALDEQIVVAMKNGDKFTRDILRGLKDTSEKIVQKRLEQMYKKGQEITDEDKQVSDEDFLAAVKREIKACEDTNAAIVDKVADVKYREIYHAKAKAVEVLSQYLPKQLTESEVVEVVKTILAGSSESGIKMGQAMKMVMPELKDKADGKLINKVVAEHVNGN